MKVIGRSICAQSSPVRLAAATVDSLLCERIPAHCYRTARSSECQIKLKTSADKKKQPNLDVGKHSRKETRPSTDESETRGSTASHTQFSDI